MLATLFSKLGIYIIIGLLVVGIMVGGFAYIEHLKIANKTLADNVATLQTSNAAEQLQITTLQAQYAEVARESATADAKITAATAQAKSAQQTISQQNLNASAQKNSGALVIQLDKSTDAIFQAWRDLSK